MLAVTTPFPAEKLYEATIVTAGLHKLLLTVTREQAQRLPRLNLRIGILSKS